MHPSTLTTLILLALCTGALADSHEEQIAFFEKNVRPVLLESCIKCHGPEKQKHGLRLDSPEAFLKGSDDGPIFTKENPDASPLVQALLRAGDHPMPPKNPLPPPQVDSLLRWAKMGAPYPEIPGVAQVNAPDPTKHWAFQPVHQPPAPPVQNPSWIQSPIDHFVLAKLEAQGMTPSPPADRRTLLRRATFDLTGLPPTAEEIATFEKDSTPDAFSRVIDRLLASPHYGERWGRHWLDVARYADTKGYVFQEERRYPYAYTYRDWVIRALNEDLPYDQFLIAQIAADQMPGADSRNLAALGFLTVGRRFLNNQADIIDDRIDVVARGTMALTVACARCHDHKYDPIPTADYYSLYGVFASSTEPKPLPLLNLADASPAQQRFQKELESREAKVTAFLTAKQRESTTKLRTPQRIQAGLLAAHAAQNLPEDQIKSLADQSHLPVAEIQHWQRFLKEQSLHPHPIFAPWLAFANLPATQFASAVENFLAQPSPNPPASPLLINALRSQPPTDLKALASLYGPLLHRLATLDTPLPNAEEEALRLLLSTPKSPTSPSIDQVKERFNAEERGQLAELRKKVDAWQSDSTDAPPRAMAVVDLPQPVEPHIFKRGKSSNLGDPVPRQFLQILSAKDRQPFQKGSGRLELAQAIASKNNPLTARVAVNRVWLHHFGAGLIRTPGDFGVRTAPSPQSELLDYLATHLVTHGWSLKNLHRLILLSATYQQSSQNNPLHQGTDPDNLLLWRMNRQRLDFEAMRDSLLAASGRLDLTPGGRASDILSDRRTVYAAIDRQNLPSIFRTFDFSSPDATTPQRFHTVGPQQALFMMNSPFVIAQAKALAALPAVAQFATDTDRLEFFYRRTLGRNPDPAELRTGLQFIAQTTPAAEKIPPAWHCGFGSFDPSTKTVAFTPFPHWTGSAWQGGEKLPHPKIGWAMLHATGGHPGGTPELMAIRRWIAPRTATIAISGNLTRAATVGDGIHARIVATRAGVVGDWTLEGAGKIATTVDRLDVQTGDTVDFIVDCRAHENSDSFDWIPEIRTLEGEPLVWNAQKGFAGPTTLQLTAWEKFVQVLLASNEFVFVD